LAFGVGAGSGVAGVGPEVLFDHDSVVFCVSKACVSGSCLPEGKDLSALAEPFFEVLEDQQDLVLSPLDTL